MDHTIHLFLNDLCSLRVAFKKYIYLMTKGERERRSYPNVLEDIDRCAVVQIFKKQADECTESTEF